MKLKLTAKIFTAFLLVSITGIGMLVTANSIFSSRNFDSYLQFKIMKSLAVFSNTLSDFYTKNGGWDLLADNSEIWESMVDERWPNDTKIIEGQVEDDFLGSEISIATEIAYSALPAPPSQGQYPFLTLFDIEKKRIAGEPADFHDLSVIAVQAKGKAVGWIGVKLGEQLTHPLDKVYLEKQSRALLAIGGLVLLVSVAMAFFLTRHLLAPIKRLSKATQSVTDRKFETRIPAEAPDELGSLARRFNEMAEGLEAYEEKQKQWLADISHELRTPLSVLGAEIEAHLDGIRKPDEASLSSLRDEIKHLIKIVNDLHFISLAESGSQTPEMEIVKPIPILSQALYIFSSIMEKNEMSVAIDLDQSAADLQIMGNRKNLMQLFTNLLENSLKHTDKPGSLFIHHRETGGRLHIVFEDTGPGVPEQALPRLFDRLFRTDPSRTRKTGSSGLGLAICKTIIENHKGSIVARNSEKGGLKMEISLPVLPNESSSPHERFNSHEVKQHTDRRRR